ncbi:DUF1800 domain-containing protein [Pedobacter sp. P351]|uniref:DUF1800 domain-containing protein n=1 Tax=Pedobacter superstes TaxID=3133441 RepID=UPI0030A5785B
MKTTTKVYGLLAAFICSCLFASFFNEKLPLYKFSYKEAGLTERQAAAHLLSRFTYGPSAGDIDKVVETGLEKWFQQQLDARQSDAELNEMLSDFDAINLSNTEVVNKFPQGNRVYRMAQADGVISRDSVNKSDKKVYRAQLEAYMKQKGLRPQQELFRQFINQKILRATYTNNQLQELLTDFWFNHFNVSLNKNQCAEFIPAYERDVIRPNVLGHFENLLLATAKSPAMLMYLDNFSSMGINEEMNQVAIPGRPQNAKLLQKKNARGLNENYAREVMELHTMGVDGGYTQNDVTQAARVLTGWTIYPMGDRGYGPQMKQMADKTGMANLEKRGFVHEGDFLFAANRHDTKEKVVLGKKFAAGGGYEEGVELLKMLARHPSTAKFISKKIAVRFVNDNPSQNLVDKMASTFTAKEGDIKQVLITMVSSPEFWSKQALREKTKSPFELAISAVRSLDAEIKAPYQLYSWISKMGQKMYYYQAPTGFPDKGQYWINTGALLNRMNFGLALASQRIPGVRIDLAKLNHNREPESAEAALKIYSSIILPERNLNETIKRLTPMLNDPNLLVKVETAAAKAAPSVDMNSMVNEDAVIMEQRPGKLNEKPNQSGKKDNTAMQSLAGNNSMLAQVVGVIIGSPEYQRK